MTLAPDIVEAILDDALPSGSNLFDFSGDVPLLWEEQRGRLKDSKSHIATGVAPLTNTPVPSEWWRNDLPPSALPAVGLGPRRKRFRQNVVACAVVSQRV